MNELFHKIPIFIFYIFIAILLPFYIYIVMRFAGEAISRTIKFFKEENESKNKEK